MTSEQLRTMIVNQLDLEQLPSDVQGAVLVNLAGLAQQQSMLDAYDVLSGEDQKTLKEYFASGDPLELRAWLTQKLPHFDDIVFEATKKVVGQYQQMRLEVSAT